MVPHENQDTYSRVVTIVAQILNIDKSAISSESSLEELGADSLDMLEIIVQLEETFSIEISDKQAEEVVTINDAVKKIEELKKK